MNQGDGGFMAGLSHPVLGFDHFLAMLSVGILSAQMGGRAIWTVPLTFVSVMAIGGVIGIKGIGLPGVEYGIAISVAALGISLAMEKKLSIILAMMFVGFFALFHGHAHGTEMPSIAQPAFYALGFITGTAGIHITGVLIGLISSRSLKGAEFLRFVGAGIAGIGIYILYILTKY
jgi:urease accessory protein